MSRDTPSDLHGLNVVRFDGSPESRERLKARLERTGCQVRPSGTGWLAAGHREIEKALELAMIVTPPVATTPGYAEDRKRLKREIARLSMLSSAEREPHAGDLVRLREQLRALDQPAAGSGVTPKAVSADVRATLIGTSRSSRVIIRNLGPCIARSIDLTATGAHDPILGGERDLKLPIPELLPGDDVSLVSGVTLESGPVFDAELRWTNEDGSPAKRATRLVLS